MKKRDAVLALVQAEEEWKSDAYIDSMARSKGWILSPIELRGETFCYNMLCPTCIQADLVRFQRLEHFFLNEK